MKNLLLKLVVLFLFGASLGQTVGLSAIWSGVGLTGVYAFIGQSLVGVVSANGIDISDLTTLLGSYVKVPKNAADIWRRVFSELELMKYMRKISGQTGKYAGLSSSSSELVQGFQSGFTPKGQIAFTPYMNEIYRLKVDYLLNNIDEIVDGYIDFMADESKLREDWPITKYIIDNHLISDIIRDLEVAMVKGSFVAPTSGTPTTLLQSMTGLFTIAANEIVATNLVPITTGVTTSANAVTNFELFAKSIDIEDLKNGGVILTSIPMLGFYKDDYRTTFGSTNDQASKNRTTLDNYPNVEIVGLRGAGASQRMMFTPTGPKGNLLHMYDKVFTPKSFEVQKENRDIKMLTDWHTGVGFSTLDRVYVNDQA